MVLNYSKEWLYNLEEKINNMLENEKPDMEAAF
jgi:hypothetical protein